MNGYMKNGEARGLSGNIKRNRDERLIRRIIFSQKRRKEMFQRETSFMHEHKFLRFSSLRHNKWRDQRYVSNASRPFFPNNSRDIQRRGIIRGNWD